MPKRSPFTLMYEQVARLANPARADLHVHTTASDGEYTPSQVVALARRDGLAAVAVTDHDTCAGVSEAVATAANLSGKPVEVVPGVEITTEYAGRELHLLAYFVDVDHPELRDTFGRMCARRRERFRDYLAKLAERGTQIPDDRAAIVERATASLGRRHVANLLVACGFARSVPEGFYRFMMPLKGTVTPKEKLPIGEAIRLAHDAGGVTSLAHPPDLPDEAFAELRSFGLDAVELNHVRRRSGTGGRLRAVAERYGFAITSGSDCHGPAHRRIGSDTTPGDTLDRLRDRCGGAPPARV